MQESSVTKDIKDNFRRKRFKVLFFAFKPPRKQNAIQLKFSSIKVMENVSFRIFFIGVFRRSSTSKKEGHFCLHPLSYNHVPNTRRTEVAVAIHNGGL